MNGRKVEELQRAIGTLTQEELEELRLWLDEYAGPRPLDRRIEADLAAGRLDKAVQTALDDEKRGRVRPLSVNGTSRHGSLLASLSSSPA
jgi:hypothetical protein